MVTLQLIVSLSGATLLLLYAVRMVQTGIERAFGPSFKRTVLHAERPLRGIAVGAGLAVILQSSAAVAILVSGFAAGGAIGFAPGLSVILGGDLGSAIVVQVLSVMPQWVIPVLLTLGGGLFLRSTSRTVKQAGRILLGVAFILIALTFLRAAVEPIRESRLLPVIVSYLETDFITSFILGTLLALVMMSSVAVVLTVVALVSTGAVPLMAGLSLVLGANLGSAMIPVWITRSQSAAARRPALANLLLRGAAAVVALLLINRAGLDDLLGRFSPAQDILFTHLAFNALLPIFLIFRAPLERLFSHWPVDAPNPAENAPGLVSALNERALMSPRLALSSLKREVLRMSQLVEQMVSALPDCIASSESPAASMCRSTARHLAEALDGVRAYVAALPNSEMSKDEKREARDLAENAISLKRAGDLISENLLGLIERKERAGIKFSEDGEKEIRRMVDRLQANMALAFDVLVSDDVEIARQVIEEKAEMVKMEMSSRRKHLKRLRDGLEQSLVSSDCHLEMLRVLKDINSALAAIAYPVLARHEQLLETRLVREDRAGR